MPLYYFHVETDGKLAPAKLEAEGWTTLGVGDVGSAGRGAGKQQGLRLSDIAEARSHAKALDDAIRFSGHSMQGRWAIVVTNEHGTVVYEIRRER